MARKPTGKPTGRPPTRASTPEIERQRENARRYYYGLPPITKERKPAMPAEEAKARNNASKRDSRQERIDRLADYKLAKQCADCDREFTKAYHLDFDHLPGVDKRFNLSKPGGRSWQLIMDEVDKCEVVCALCHRDRTMSRKAGQVNYGKHRGTPLDQHPKLWEG